MDAVTKENNANTIARMQVAVDAVSVECSSAHAERLRAAWAETQELIRGWQAIAAGYQDDRLRALDALDNISTAVDQFRPDVNDPFVKHVLAVLTARDSAGPLPALLSDVTMGG